MELITVKEDDMWGCFLCLQYIMGFVRSAKTLELGSARCRGNVSSLERSKRINKIIINGRFVVTAETDGLASVLGTPPDHEGSGLWRLRLGRVPAFRFPGPNTLEVDVMGVNAAEPLGVWMQTLPLFEAHDRAK